MLLAFTSQTFSWSTAFKPFIQQVVVISLSHQAYKVPRDVTLIFLLRPRRTKVVIYT